MSDDVAKPGEINGDAFDRFTLAHLGAGVALGHFGVPWWVIISGALVWELIERPLKKKIGCEPPLCYPSGDTVPNAIVDVGAVIAGAALMKMWMAKR